MEADARIIAALTETPPAMEAPPHVRAAWSKLQAKLAEYDECVASNRAAEGLNISMSIEAAAKQVVEYHQSYVQQRAGAAAAPGTDPRLLAQPRAFCVDHSLIPMPA